MPYFRNDNQHQYVTNFNWTKGTHTLRFGMDLYHQAMNHTQPEFSGSRGARGGFDFGAGPTSLCITPDGRGGCLKVTPSSPYHAFATFLLGLPTGFGKNLETVVPYTTRNWQYSFYVRDQWQATRKFTFSYGVRWEYFPVATRADRGFERYNINTNKMEIGGIGSVPKDFGIKVSKTLFAPRLGIAYRATNSFVIRAGYGITNDPYSLARPMRTNYPVLIDLNVQAPNSLQFAGRLADGIPPIVPPDLGNGIIDIPGNVSVVTLPDMFNRGYIQSWNLTLQKELKWGFVGEVGYVGTREVRKLGFRELNWAPIGGGRAGRQLFGRFGRDASTLLVTPIGGSHYDSLQAQLERRFSAGYQLGVNYTLSKSIGTQGNDNSDGTLAINIPEFYRLNRALTGFDRTHNLQITNMTELPFGRGRRWLSNKGWLSAIVGNWQVNNIISLYSGTPFNIVSDGVSLNAPGNSQRADLVKSRVRRLGGVGRGQAYFDPLAFAPVTEARFGTAGFRILRGPGLVNWDFSLFRDFRIRENLNIQFRAEAFNFTNTPHFDNPGNNVSRLRLSSDGSVKDLNGFAEITSARQDERQFRFGIRIGF